MDIAAMFYYIIKMNPFINEHISLICTAIQVLEQLKVS